MPAILRFFWELCLLRRAPQDLPASTALLASLLAINLVLGTVAMAAQFGGSGTAFLASALDAAVLAGLLYATLSFAGHPRRYVQTLTAMYGVTVLFSAVLVAVQWLAVSLQLEVLAAFASLVLLAWVHVALGHVLRHALEMDLWAGIVIAIGYTVISLILVSTYFPTVAVN
ncbi:MAG: hypothetical protein P8106_00370 [Gammaproteobacteria bacterium]